MSSVTYLRRRRRRRRGFVVTRIAVEVRTN